MSLGVYREGVQVGRLDRQSERAREYAFRYTGASHPISLALPLRRESFSPAESRPFFEALLPEGDVRERIAGQLKLAGGDSYGLLAALGGDCAGALQILDVERSAATPSVQWLDPSDLDALVEELPRHPLGITAGDRRLRLSLAGVQRKAVLLRDRDGRFGKPLDGMPSSHILKPELPGSEYPGLARNECFCMLLATRCGLSVAGVELIEAAGRPCLVVERFDRSADGWPPSRLHQEDLCQALGLTPDFKYQRQGWRLPSYAGLAGLIDEHSLAPGLDRLAAARAVLFNFLVGNADAHAKNISLLHVEGGVRLAPLYDLVSTAAYPELSTELSLSIGDELDPDAIGHVHWLDLAYDFGLEPAAFERERRDLAERIGAEAVTLRERALAEGWHHECIDATLETFAARSPRVT
jgi:serine/threonine-protein kinase HipA